MSNIEIDIQSVHRWLQSGSDDDGQAITLIDCREQNECAIAKIDNAILMPMGQWPPSEDALASLEGKRVVASEC